MTFALSASSSLCLAAIFLAGLLVHGTNGLVTKPTNNSQQNDVLAQISPTKRADELPNPFTEVQKGIQNFQGNLSTFLSLFGLNGNGVNKSTKDDREVESGKESSNNGSGGKGPLAELRSKFAIHPVAVDPAQAFQALQTLTSLVVSLMTPI